MLRKYRQSRIFAFSLLISILALALSFAFFPNKKESKNLSKSPISEHSNQINLEDKQQEISKKHELVLQKKVEKQKSGKKIDLSEKNQKNIQEKNIDLAIAKTINKKPKKELKYQPRLDLNYKYSSDRQLGRLEALIPLLQNDKNLFFSDIRGWLDNENTQEGNLGLGFRTIAFNQVILGVYGFYDRKITASDNIFTQKTFGAEALTENWDFRTNFYFPQQKAKITSQTNYNSPQLQGYNIFLGNASYEFPTKGFDFEIGRTIPKFEKLKLFAGYYHFENKAYDFVSRTNTDGYRLRANFEAFNHNQHHLFFEGEYSHDDLRKETNFIGLKYRFDFGTTKSHKNKLSTLQQRMTNEIVRDVDIVLGEVKNSPMNLKNDNGSTQRIIYIDANNTNQGDGTKENPFNDLITATNFSKASDIIYIFYSNGANLNSTSQLILKDNQKLIGQGVSLKISTINSNIAVDQDIITGSDTEKSKITFTVGNNFPIIAANNNYIAGLEITDTNSGARGVSATNISDISIVNNKITGNISISSNLDSTNNIKNNTITSSLNITSSGNAMSTNNISDNKISETTTGIFQIQASGSSQQTNNITNNTNGNNANFFSQENSKQTNNFDSNSFNVRDDGKSKTNITSNYLSTQINNFNINQNTVRDFVIVSNDGSNQTNTIFNTTSNSITIDSKSANILDANNNTIAAKSTQKNIIQDNILNNNANQIRIKANGTSSQENTVSGNKKSGTSTAITASITKDSTATQTNH